MLRGIAYAVVFAMVQVAIFVLGAPLFAAAGLGRMAEIALPIAVLGGAAGGFTFGWRLQGRPPRINP